MTLPEIQAELRSIADMLSEPLLLPVPVEDVAKRLRFLTSQISRRKAVRKAPVQSVSVGPSRAAQIRADVRANPDLAYEVFATKYNCSIGRVSEAVAGKRF
jgi:hypothetical protein